LSRFASGVTVVTTTLPGGEQKGLTVSAFSSLSLDPPLILICIDRKASLHEHLDKGSHFAVNILSEDQETVSRRFASREDSDRFSGVEVVSGQSGSPLILGSLASIECRVVDALPGGDHTIFVGEVESVTTGDGKPLLYCLSCYGRLA
jgi:flavin reductase (DIM6/NTAB) family NADH-FMN oxidoreductase RutF